MAAVFIAPQHNLTRTTNGKSDKGNHNPFYSNDINECTCEAHTYNDISGYHVKRNVFARVSDFLSLNTAIIAQLLF